MANLQHFSWSIRVIKLDNDYMPFRGTDNDSSIVSHSSTPTNWTRHATERRKVQREQRWFFGQTETSSIILRWTRPPYFAIRDCLFDLGLKAAMTVRKEPRHLLCDGTGDKPADVLFASFSQGRDLCVDVTVVNPLFCCHLKQACFCSLIDHC
jgi:hypothetical protein